MLRSVLLKTLHDQRRALPVWALGLVALIAMYAAIWPSVQDQPAMAEFLRSMPEAMRALFAAAGADMSTPAGYVQVELLSFVGPGLLIGYAVAAGAAGVAGEEAEHTLDLLLANPIGRGRVVVEKLAAAAVGTGLLAAVSGLALVVLGRPVGLDLPVFGVAAAMLHLALLALVFGALAAAVGAGTGSAAAARAVPAGTAIVAYVVNALGPLVDWLEPLQRLSPFHQYAGHDPLRSGVSLAGVAVAAGTVLVLTAIAVPAFDRRDVAG